MAAGPSTVRLRHGTAEIQEGGVLGAGMTRPDEATVLAAMNRLDLGRPWSKASADVRPMLPRIRPYPYPVEPVRTMLPPGILVGFGVDIGPGLTMVDVGQLERWGVSVDAVAERAIHNVREIAARCDPGRVVRQSVADVPVMALRPDRGGNRRLAAPRPRDPARVLRHWAAVAPGSDARPADRPASVRRSGRCRVARQRVGGAGGSTRTTCIWAAGCTKPARSTPFPSRTRSRPRDRPAPNVKRRPEGRRLKRVDVEPTLGLEPRTCCLRNSCSTTELCRRDREYRR